MTKTKTIAQVNQEDNRKNPYKCATCKQWVGKKCRKFPQIRGVGEDGALSKDGAESCMNGWEGKNGERRPFDLGKGAERDQARDVEEIPPDPDSGITVYVVLAKRWGCNERHSYVVGVGATVENAQEIANNEEQNRGGKYSCDILRTRLNRVPKDLDELPWVWKKAMPRQPEPGEAEWLCSKHYKCPHIIKRKK